MQEEKYSYYTKFKIASERDLDDLWSFMIFRLNIQREKIIYDRFARLYNLLLEHKYLLNTKVTIFIFETENNFVVKLKTNIQAIKDALINKLQQHDFPFRLEKKSVIYDIKKRYHTPDHQSKTIDTPKKKLFVFKFIKQDDLDELTNIIEKMQERQYRSIFPYFTETELNDYRSALSYFSSMTRLYSQMRVVSNVVAETSVILSLYTKECLDRPDVMRSFLQGMISNLETWLTMLFVDGCERVDFMDASFVADLAQLKVTLELYDDTLEDADSSNLDEIFDF